MSNGLVSKGRTRSRGAKTICIPISEDEYQRVIDDPQKFRKVLDRLNNEMPDIFPRRFSQGYLMKDDRTSNKAGVKIRRIELSAEPRSSYSIRPSFVMPYMTARTKDVEAPLFCASSASPTGA